MSTTTMTTVDTEQFTTGLNPAQAAVFNQIISLQGNDRLRLNAPGGCGKTYTLIKVIEYMTEIGKNVLVVAPTHMARQGLIDKIDPKYAHLVESKTVASLLGRFGLRGQSGDTIFTKAKEPKLGNCDLIILDECSMLSNKDLIALATLDIPVVFSGDLKQLPVIKQKKAVWDDIPLVQLNVQMRQSGPVHELAEKLREGIYYPKSDIDHDPQAGLHVLESIDDMLLGIAEAVAADPARAYEHRVLTYKNVDVANYNKLVRDLVLQEKATEAFVPGEYVILGETCAAGYNAEILRVDEILEATPNPVYPHLTDYLVNFENGHTLRVLSPTDQVIIEDIRLQLKATLKQARERKHGEAIKQAYGALEYLDYNWTKINYTYATTVHKSQGQTIPNVYVDTPALSKASNKRALLYVAFSRASENLYTLAVS